MRADLQNPGASGQPRQVFIVLASVCSECTKESRQGAHHYQHSTKPLTLAGASQPRWAPTPGQREPTTVKTWRQQGPLPREASSPETWSIEAKEAELSAECLTAQERRPRRGSRHCSEQDRRAPRGGLSPGVTSSSFCRYSYAGSALAGLKYRESGTCNTVLSAFEAILLPLSYELPCPGCFWSWACPLEASAKAANEAQGKIICSLSLNPKRAEGSRCIESWLMTTSSLHALKISSRLPGEKHLSRKHSTTAWGTDGQRLSVLRTGKGQGESSHHPLRHSQWQQRRDGHQPHRAASRESSGPVPRPSSNADHRQHHSRTHAASRLQHETQGRAERLPR